MHTLLPWNHKIKHPALQHILLVLAMLGLSMLPVLLSVLLIKFR